MEGASRRRTVIGTAPPLYTHPKLAWVFSNIIPDHSRLA